jgi:hypothetical protein
VSLAPIKLIGPRAKAPLAGPGGTGRIWIGPGHGPHLYVFFDTWEREVSDLRADLKGLNRYAAMNSVAPLTAIDEADVEASRHALPDFLAGLSLAYPVAVDKTGRVADGYGVQDSPWLTLVSGSGKILWSYDVGAKGWLTTTQLVSRVHAALAHARASARAERRATRSRK